MQLTDNIQTYIHQKRTAVNPRKTIARVLRIARNAAATILLTTAFTGGLAAQNIQKYAFNVGDFGQLRVIDPLNVVYHASADSAGYVVFEAEPSMAPRILVQNTKGTLKLQVQDDGLKLRHLPTVHVYSAFISKAENSGDSTLTIDHPAPGAELKLRVVGNGHIIARGLHVNKAEAKIDTGKGDILVTGRTNSAKLRTVGSGDIYAAGLHALTASILIGGTGSVECNVSDELNVTGLGSGKVYLTGNPVVKNRTLGTVKIINTD